MFVVIAFLLGIVAGLRSLTPVAAIAWLAASGLLALNGTPLELLGSRWSPWILTLLAIGELVADKLPQTPSRKTAFPFGARLLVGAVVGAAIGHPAGMPLGGLVAGVLGAVAGTLGGAAMRGRLAARLGRDLPAALVEDAVAIIGTALLASWAVALG
jgi:uncharacterized membrane protein